MCFENQVKNTFFPFILLSIAGTLGVTAAVIVC